VVLVRPLMPGALGCGSGTLVITVATNHRKDDEASFLYLGCIVKT
jgi:hypothetical protein